MLPLSQIIQKYDIFFHFYTDDTQLYLLLKPNHQSNLISLMNSSLEEIKYWMTQNFLQLNEGKSEVILFASPDSSKVITILPLGLTSKLVNWAPQLNWANMAGKGPWDWTLPSRPTEAS